jgi:uncharacterized membrane protein YgdD (TMEM256/DUF423 family)
MTHTTDDDRTTDRMLALAAILGLFAVALGAFGAHGLRSLLADASDASERIRWWETAASYHLAHALACGLAAWAHGRRRSRASIASAILFAIGVIVFAGSLYAMALGAPRWLGAITPLGGLSLMAGWIALAASALRR